MKIIKNKLWAVLAVVMCVASVHTPAVAMDGASDRKAKLGLLFGGAVVAALGAFYYKDFCLKKSVEFNSTVGTNIFLGLGADPNKHEGLQRFYPRYPLPLTHVAWYNRNPAIMTSLLENGADPDAQGALGIRLLQQIAESSLDKSDTIKGVLHARSVYLKRINKPDKEVNIDLKGLLLNVDVDEDRVECPRTKHVILELRKSADIIKDLQTI